MESFTGHGVGDRDACLWLFSLVSWTLESTFARTILIYPLLKREAKMKIVWEVWVPMFPFIKTSTILRSTGLR
jgi:hypothetical protein